MSAETPRTDEAAVGFARLLVDKETFTVTELVDANFARVLERELAAAQAAPAQEPTITVSGPVACGKSYIMELIYKALRDAGLHPYSDDLAHERRMVEEQPQPPAEVWKLREAVYAAPPPPAPAQEPVALNEREGLQRKAEEYRDRALHLEHLEAVALRYRDLWLICHENDQRPAENGEVAKLAHLRGLLFAAAGRNAAPQPDEARDLLRQAYNELIVDEDGSPEYRLAANALVVEIRAYLKKHK